MEHVPEIVLLSPPHDAMFLSAFLQRLAPGMALNHAGSAEALAALFAEGRPGARLVAYATDVIVPGALLERLDGPAYNFHPGPPAYPGRHPLQFALYDGARQYGVTAHVMTERVDSGPIVGTLLFDVPENADLAWLGVRSTQALAKLFVHMAPYLVAKAPLPAQDTPWGPRRTTRRCLDAMLDLPPGIDADEMERRRRVFHSPEQPLRMTVHGRRFVLSD